MFELIFSNRSMDQLFIGRIDPRAKFILFMCFISEVLFLPANNLIPFVVLGLILVVLIIVTGLPVSKIAKAVLKVYPMILMISFFQLITIGTGEDLTPGLRYFNIPRDAWIQISGFQFKTIFILTASLLFIASTPIKSLLSSIEKLKAPAWIVAMTFFIYRFVFILTHELTRLQIAYRSRYIKLPVIKQLYIQARLLAKFLTRIFERNERLYDALISRGFNGVIPSQIHISWKNSDTIMIICGLTFLMLTQWMI
jgi:cobalt/nickel transport system permease protein